MEKKHTCFIVRLIATIRTLATKLEDAHRNGLRKKIRLLKKANVAEEKYTAEAIAALKKRTAERQKKNTERLDELNAQLADV